MVLTTQEPVTPVCVSLSGVLGVRHVLHPWRQRCVQRHGPIVGCVSDLVDWGRLQQCELALFSSICCYEREARFLSSVSTVPRALLGSGRLVATWLSRSFSGRRRRLCTCRRLCLTAIHAVVTTAQVTVPEWILVIGGTGIVLGLALFSSNISRCLGVQVTKITYARGFCAEFATAIVVAVASRYGGLSAPLICAVLCTKYRRQSVSNSTGLSSVVVGLILVAVWHCAEKQRLAGSSTCMFCAGLPVSTTQTVCGALLAIGLMEGLKGVNWWACLRVRC